MNQIYLVPGPTRVPAEVRAVYQRDYGSSDLNPEFLALYAETAQLFQQLLQTESQVIFMTGEAMLGLWGGLKSCLQPGDRVVAIANGVFGQGIGEMAASCGAEVGFITSPYDQAFSKFTELEQAIIDFKPKMITAVHCETPSGIVNPIATIGALKAKHQVPLLYVDAVASIGGMPVEVDKWHIDICLGGSQKALSCPPDMTLLAISPMAAAVIQEVGYGGYDALASFISAQEQHQFPYTPNWQGLAALNVAVQSLFAEGLEQVFARHQLVAAYCRNQIKALGFELYPHDEKDAAATVTAVKVPESISWQELNARFIQQGLYVGGSYGPLADKVFRLGHMGSQAKIELVEQAKIALEKVKIDIQYM